METETEMEMVGAQAQTEPVQPARVSAPKRGGRRWLVGISVLVAVLALVAFAGSTLAAPPRGIGAGPMGAGPGMMGPNGVGRFGHGIRAVVTGVDTGANTITLAGLPTQVSTVKVDNTVKLVTLQADGTTKPAAIGDFKSGSLVRVGFGRGNGSDGNGSNNNGGAAGMTGTPGVGNRGGNFAVTELALVPDNIAEVSGLVLANNNGTYTIASDGGLRLTVKTTGSTTYTKTGNQSASAGDIKVGSRIIVSGTQAPDGVTADTVRVMDFSNFPMGGQMPRGRMPGANGTPAATVTR